MLNGGCAEEEGLILIRDRHPEAVIYLPSESGEAVVLAAKELQDYLQKIGGGKLAIVSEKPEQGAYITFQKEKNISDDLFERDSFTLQTSEQGVIIRGQTDIALLYGAYQFLNNLGVYWFSPGEIGENVPQLSDVVVEVGSETYRPSFRTRMIDYSGLDHWHFDKEVEEQQHQDYDRWLLRNKLQFQRMIHNRSEHHHYDFGWSRELSFHNLRNAALGVGWQESSDLDPERLALVSKEESATRQAKDAQICFTHLKNIETAIQSAVTYFEEFPERVTYPLSTDDHYGFCECEKCMEANGGVSPSKDPNRVVWGFMNKVAKELEETAPGKQIAFYATYQLMTHPPYDIQAAPNLVAVTCHVTSQARRIMDPEEPRNVVFLNNVRLVKGSGVALAAYDYFMFPGNPQPLALLEDIKLYHELGYVWYSAEWMGRDEQRYIVAWVLAQLAWNVDQDPHALLETFCQKYYGDAGASVMKWLDLIESRIHRMKRITFGHLGLTAVMLTDEVVEEGREMLTEAATKVSGQEAERVQRLALTFESWVRAAEVDRLYKQALKERTEASKQRVTEAVKEFEEFWNKNHLSRICSPRLLNHYVKEYLKKIEKIHLKVHPSASKDITGAMRPQVIDALFFNAEMDVPTLLRESEETGEPQRNTNMVLLPEIWKFQIDPDDVENSGSIQDAEGPDWSKPDYDDSMWKEISTYNHFDSQGYADYKGIFWYRLRFNAPDFPAQKRIWLRIGALDDGGSIYLNGKLVGEREHLREYDWKVSFAFDVTKLIKRSGENVIAIRGENVFGAGGLWKPVGLYTREL